MRTCVRALGQPREGSEHAGPAAGDRRVRGPHLRRSRGARHPLSRGQARSGLNRVPAAVADAVPVDDQPVPRLHPRVRLSTASPARPTPTWTSTRARTSSARSWSRSTCPEVVRAELAAAVVEGRARRPRHQHRPLPVGRGALPADGGDLGGDARLRQPVLGADQVAAAAARHRADEADLASGPSSSPTSRSRPWRRRPGGRPSRTRRIRASGSRRSPSCPRRDPDRGADRAADPGRQRRAGAGRGAGRGGRRGGRREHRRRRPAPARRGARDLVRLAAPVPARPRRRATRSSIAGAPTWPKDEREELARRARGKSRPRRFRTVEAPADGGWRAASRSGSAGRRADAR